MQSIVSKAVHQLISQASFPTKISDTYQLMHFIGYDDMGYAPSVVLKGSTKIFKTFSSTELERTTLITRGWFRSVPWSEVLRLVSHSKTQFSATFCEGLSLVMACSQ